jgi:hypothetical protein
MLTENQKKIIAELSAAFEGMNPKATDKKRQFSMASMVEEIKEKERLKVEVDLFNKAIAQQLHMTLLEQINEFNAEFAPIKLYIRDDQHLANAEIGQSISLCFINTKTVLFAYFTCENYKSFTKITGLSLSREAFCHYISLKSIEDALQNSNSFRHDLREQLLLLNK